MSKSTATQTIAVGHEAAPERLAYTIQEVARMLGVHYRTIYREVKAGRLASTRFGSGRGRHLILRRELDRYLTAHTGTGRGATRRRRRARVAAVKAPL